MKNFLSLLFVVVFSTITAAELLQEEVDRDLAYIRHPNQ